MSVEAYNPTESHLAAKEKIRGVEVAVEAVVRLRTLIADIEYRLGIHQSETAFNPAMVESLEKRYRELTAELQDSLAFIEEFDPRLYKRLKDIS